SLMERRGAGIPFTPIDARCNSACDREHLRIVVDANDVCDSSEPVASSARHDACSARDVEETIAWGQLYLIEDDSASGLIKRSGEIPLVHLRESCLAGS